MITIFPSATTGSTGATDVDDLQDVTITSIVDNDVLQYDNTTSKWVNRTLSGAGALMEAELASVANVKALNQNVASGTSPNLDVGSMTLDNTDLVVADTTNLQTFANKVDHALLKARGTGLSSTYVSTVAVGGTTFAQPTVDGEIYSDQGYFHVTYAGATGITVANLASSSTYVYIDNTGALQQQTTTPTRQDWSRKLFTMRIGVDTSTNLILGFEYLNNTIGHYANTIRDVYSYLLAQGIPFKKDQIVTGRATDLGFNVSAGSLLELGGTGDVNNPNIKPVEAVTNASYALVSRTAIVSTETNLIKSWDNAGTITALGSTTVVGHRLYRFSNGNFAMQYGQGNYANITLARAGVLTEQYALNPILENATFFGWWLIQETATNTGGTTLTSFKEYTIGIQGGSSSGLSGALLTGNNLSDVLSAVSARSNLGLVIGTNVQAYDTVLDNTTASFTTAQETKLSNTSGTNTGDQSKASLGLVIGTDVQAYATVLANTTASFTTAEETKLSGIETDADVTANATGTASGLTAGNVTTNANLTGIVTSTGNATAIANKAIALAKLADGTDGELITWDASGVAATIAAGTADQVLTSNGAGAAATFQDASGGGGGGVFSTSGTENYFAGTTAGDSLTTGTNNFFAGLNAGTGVTGGSSNVIVGHNAGDRITTASNTVAVGLNAMGTGFTTGNDNVAIGQSAGDDLTSGIQNVFLGFFAGTNTTTGSDNVSFGRYALGYGNTTGSENVALGKNSQFFASGSGNISLGNSALFSASGNNNIALGFEAAYALTTATNNIAIGATAMRSGAVTGTHNIAVGSSAGKNLTSGASNTFIGNSAGTGISFATGSNTTALGNSANPSTSSVSNEFTLGNTSITSFRCQVALTVLSDKRDKAEIEPLGNCLDFINDLNTKSFIMADRSAETKTQGSVRTGVLAQDLLSVIEKHNIAGTHNLVNTTNPDRLEVTTSDLVFPMIKAMQEMSAQMEKLKAEINLLKGV
jgi:hypothetical protein